MMTPDLSEENTPPLSKRPAQSLKFSQFFTIVLSIFFLAGNGLIMWGYASLSPLERVAGPERSLERLTSRILVLEHAFRQVAKGEQLLYRLLSGNENAVMRAIREYEELENYSDDPLVDLYLGILEVEAGHQEAAAKRIQAWKGQAAPFPLFREFLQAAYFPDSTPLPDVEKLQAHLAEEVPDNWFYSRLAIQIAKNGGDTGFALLTERRLNEGAYQLLWSNRLLILFEVGGSLFGLVVMALVVKRYIGSPPGSLRVSRRTLPPRWTETDGFAVLVRGGAISTFLLLLLSLMELSSQMVVIASMLILYGPVVLLAYYYLVLPNNLTVNRAFGFRISYGRGKRVFWVLFVLLSAGLIGDWVITVALGPNHGSLHWTEWFDQNLVWGTPIEAALTLVEYSMIAPFFEEVIFRGILFATLRHRFGWGTSAVFSALLFSIVHGYGLVGFLTIFWSGMLWAWAYEKTGSLWPGVIAHGMNNLLVSLTLIALFR